MKKWIITIIAVMVIGFGGYQWYTSKSSAKQVPVQIRTATVQKGKLEVKVSGSGTIQPITSEDIKSPLNNNSIAEVLVSSGDSVKKGDELITFTDGSSPITAPADGVITTITVSAGERVTAGQVVAHLTNYSDLKAVVQIDELDIPKIQLNQTATLKVNAYPDQSYTGKVTAIANEGTTTNGVSTFDVTIGLDQSQNLKVGMSTEASILTASKDNALYIPLEAVHTANNQKFVLLASAGTTEQTGAMQQRKIIKTGLANEDYVEITEGLTEGETVRLPQLATNSTVNGAQGRFNQGGFGGGVNRLNRLGGGGGNKTGISGRGGNG
ncbi:efflux RND transporter periplasmic adaptor subunit [Neobacillus sp. SM06]|uniref:efflux RND transporter periplasmic adaptor subunit n=1 Tax=Neobacillus sp. SM06 TaxID=3422492 RepID=UPI003D2A3772